VEEKMNRLKIPETDSIQELARFWDMHDLTDFDDQLEEVPEPVFERKMEPVLVPLQPQEVEAVKRIAESEGVEYVALIRGWVLEKLHTS
jgi:predicted DNA binding CopG/RHH family protein